MSEVGSKSGKPMANFVKRLYTQTAKEDQENGGEENKGGEAEEEELKGFGDEYMSVKPIV